MRLINLESGVRQDPPEGYWGQVLLKVRARGRGRLGADKVLELREAWQLHRKNSVREWCCWGCLGVIGGVLRVGGCWDFGVLESWGFGVV